MELPVSVADRQAFLDAVTAWSYGERQLTGLANLQAAAAAWDAMRGLLVPVDGTSKVTVQPNGGILVLSDPSWSCFRRAVRTVVEDGVPGQGRMFDARRSLAVLAWMDGAHNGNGGGDHER